MKTWKTPVAVAQQFAANDYVSACYYVKCQTPLNNARFNLSVLDTNGNGVWDPDTDEVLYNPTWYGYNEFSGCAGKSHLVRLAGDTLPTANGFVIKGWDASGTAYPVYTFVGDVIGAPNAGNINHKDDVHSTDLTAEGAIIPATGADANFS